MNFTKKDDCLKIIDHSVIKSPNDKNEYYYDMLPNGLRYIVISNKDIDKSAVGMDVYIGSADDPKEYQGLAHCLEHMIFLGTEKYPKPSGFDDFLNKNSGYSNANTSLDHTNYHFEICNDKLEEGIDMFSEFFSKPLFTNELLNKELNAIQSEFISDYRDDLNRLYHLILIEGYKDSPFNTFINGNLETLQKPEIRDKAIEFFKKYYDPKILSLCVFSNKTIEELKNLVIKYFSKIQNIQNFQKIQKKILYDENNMGYYYKIIPVKDISCIYFFGLLIKVIINIINQIL
jgi:secreted Zn-dependent insulinase-like peptidase